MPVYSKSGIIRAQDHAEAGNESLGHGHGGPGHCDPSVH